MARRTRVTIAPHQYRDEYGIDTIVQFRKRTRRERWPLESDPDERAAWVQRALSQLMDEAADRRELRVQTRGTLAGDVTAFLKTREGRPSYAADKCNLAHWVARYRKRRRSRLTTHDVDLAIAEWRQAGVSAQTIRHRCRVLRVLYRQFDGPHARTPIDRAQVPKKPHPHPVGLPVGTIPRVAQRLEVRAQKYANTREQTLARFLVLTTTLQRPIQLQRAQPPDVDLQTRTWWVRGVKGEPAHQIYLNDDMLKAWTLFIKVDAWGPYHSGRYGTQLRAAGWPEDISTYNYRHDGAIEALRRGADLGDVQGLLGHTEIQTTRRNYAPVLQERQRRVSEMLQGRLGGDKRGGTSGGSDQRGNTPKSAGFQKPAKAAERSARRRK
jgi:site-specific recombinase XerD